MTIEEEISIAEAAKAGDVSAQLQYGKMLCGLADRVVEGLDGIEVVRYYDISNEGMEYLEKAAESGSGEAAELLQRIKNNEIHLVMESEYVYRKAMRYISGEGVEKNLSEAAEMLRDAAELAPRCNDQRSDVYRELAKLCSQVEPKPYMFGESPTQWLERLASAGDGETQHMLACVECAGTLNDYPEYSEGFNWLREQADAGRPEFQWQYGNVLIWADCNLQGIEYLRRSYENGYAAAAYSLGDLYAYDADWGEAFHPDENEAIKWFEKAIDLGSIEAAEALSNIINRRKRYDLD